MNSDSVQINQESQENYENQVIIQLVAPKDYLYDSRSKNYKNTSKKRNTWRKIAIDFELITNAQKSRKYNIKVI